MRDEYTPAQASQLLRFFEVKTPGWVDAAEKALRDADMWPEEDADV